VNDRTNAVSLLKLANFLSQNMASHIFPYPDDSPNKKCNAGSWNKVGFDGEEVANLVNREPYGGKREQPE
jgi:hypothetical protein